MAELQLEPDFLEPFNAWKASPNPTTTSALLTAVDPVLQSALRSYAGGKVSPQLRGQAKSLAIDSFGTYDPTKGKLRTHLLTNLQRLRRIQGQQAQIIRIPERISRDRSALLEASQALMETLGREPSDRELADYTGLSYKRLAQIRKAARPLAEGRFTAEVGDEGEEGFAPSVDPLEPNYDAWVRFVYDDLTPRDQFILERALGLNGHRKMAPTQIAKALKVSPAAVSQRMAYIQSLLDKREDLGIL